MKGVVVKQFTSSGDAELVEVDAPVPGVGEVVVAVAVIELGFADLLLIEGKYQRKPALPFIPGTSAVGRVVAVGDGVTWPSLHDRVALHVPHGAFAEQVRVKAEHCFAIPDGLSFEHAAALGVSYQTAYTALTERTHVRAGRKVLVLGATSGVGIASIQLARALGASTVLGAVRGARAAAFARVIGCDHAIDVSVTGSGEEFRNQVRALTAGTGVDIVIDPLGGEIGEQAIRSLAWNGTQVIIGFAAGAFPQFKGNYLLVKNVAVIGLQWTDYLERRPELVRDNQARMFQMALEGTLKPHVARTFPLSEFARALDELHHRRAYGKLLLVTGAERSS